MEKDPFKPVRSRSARSTATEAPELSLRPSVRTRGPIVEGKTAAVADVQGQLRIITLGALFKDIRKEVGGLPLTIIIHGWGAPAAEQFRLLLIRLLMKSDALWFVLTSRGRRGTRVPPAKEGAVILDLNIATDSRIYNNLVGDIIFFPALEDFEVQSAAAFRHRTRAVVVDNRDQSQPQNPIKRSLVSTALEAKLNLYLWLGPHALAECASVADLETAANAVETVDSFAIDEEMDERVLVEIGITLKELAGHLAKEFDRRFIFRSYLETIFEAYPGRPSWDRDLIKMADEHEWPTWAVECLPNFYVVVKESSAGLYRALVWDRILRCVPPSCTYIRLTEFCNGEFVEIEMPAETLSFIDLVVPTIEEHLAGLPFASDGAFNGAINEALMEVSLKPIAPEAVRRIEQARKELLERILPRR